MNKEEKLEVTERIVKQSILWAKKNKIPVVWRRGWGVTQISQRWRPWYTDNNPGVCALGSVLCFAGFTKAGNIEDALQEVLNFNKTEIYQFTRGWDGVIVWFDDPPELYLLAQRMREFAKNLE